MFHKRTGSILDNDDAKITTERYNSKLSYNAFVDAVNEEDIVLSKARKEWQVVRVDNTKTIIRDVDKKINYEMRTRDIYEAHLALEKDDIQISTIAPFVGKENAPAASALLYNIVGQGQAFNNMRKHFNEIFKFLKK